MEKKGYQFLYHIVIPFLKRKYNIHFDQTLNPDGALILCNHSSKLDPLFVCGLFPKDNPRFIVGENVVTHKKLRKIIEGYFDCIVHIRGRSEITTTREMIKRLKKKENVAIFPEGVVSYDGSTKEVNQSITKIAKITGTCLILIRIEGAYLSNPPWGHYSRKGRINVNTCIYTPEILKEESIESIHKKVNEFLYTNAYNQTDLKAVDFKGKKPAEGLENCIYYCPHCHSLSKLKTQNNRVSCTCGYEATYDSRGYLVPKDGNRLSVTDLYTEQKQYLRNIIKESREQNRNPLLFSDSLSVKKVWPDGKRQEIGRTELKIFPEYIEYIYNGGKHKIQYPDIRHIFTFYSKTMNCMIGDNKYDYELTGDFSLNPLVYRDLVEICNS